MNIEYETVLLVVGAIFLMVGVPREIQSQWISLDRGRVGRSLFVLVGSLFLLSSFAVKFSIFQNYAWGSDAYRPLGDDGSLVYVISDVLRYGGAEKETEEIKGKVQGLADSIYARGKLLVKKGNYDDGLVDYLVAAKLNINNADIYNAVAWALAANSLDGYRNGESALKYAKMAVAISPEPINIDTLAAAYAEVGDYMNAVKEQTRAIAILNDKGEKERIKDYMIRLNSYQMRKPWREVLN